MIQLLVRKLNTNQCSIYHCVNLFHTPNGFLKNNFLFLYRLIARFDNFIRKTYQEYYIELYFLLCMITQNWFIQARRQMKILVDKCGWTPHVDYRLVLIS